MRRRYAKRAGIRLVDGVTKSDPDAPAVRFGYTQAFAYDRAHGVRQRHDLTITQWRAVKARSGGRCAYCGEVPPRLLMEHMEPLSRGGRHTFSNIVAACETCNIRKGDLTPLEWFAFRAGLLRYVRAGRCVEHLAAV